jgi:Holliday junction resolvase-like predicted endonuclease
MDMNKSSRHSKITGDFGEALVLYWLSKHGFECARVDHTGIDIIARRPDKNEVMGISVKARSRYKGTGSYSVTLGDDDFEKVEKACRDFGCDPYVAIVVDADSLVRGFILSVAHLAATYPTEIRTWTWKMSRRHLQKYENDGEIMTFELEWRKNTQHVDV